MYKLIRYWKNTPSGSEPKKPIETRMAEALKELPEDSPPDWFLKMARERNIPSFLLKIFNKKANIFFSRL